MCDYMYCTYLWYTLGRYALFYFKKNYLGNFIRDIWRDLKNLYVTTFESFIIWSLLNIIYICIEGILILAASLQRTLEDISDPTNSIYSE